MRRLDLTPDDARTLARIVTRISLQRDSHKCQTRTCSNPAEFVRPIMFPSAVLDAGCQPYALASFCPTCDQNLRVDAAGKALHWNVAVNRRYYAVSGLRRINSGRPNPKVYAWTTERQNDPVNDAAREQTRTALIEAGLYTGQLRAIWEEDDEVLALSRTVWKAEPATREQLEQLAATIESSYPDIHLLQTLDSNKLLICSELFRGDRAVWTVEQLEYLRKKNKQRTG